MDVFILENNEWLIEINSIGAELYRVFNKHTKTEYLWNGDSSFWTGRAPVLFPIIGNLKNGRYRFKDKEYHMPKHGFVRGNRNMTDYKNEKNHQGFKLEHSSETLERYPFKFTLYIDFVLEDNCLSVQHRVVNLDKQPMYFSLGGHPAFSCPLGKNGSYSDWYIAFEKEETAATFMVQEEGLIKKERQPLLNHTKVLPLHPGIFEKDALIFKGLNSSKVKLASSRTNQSIEMNFEGFPYMAFWAKPNAPFVCFEPWLGIGDMEDSNGQLTQKEGIVKLNGNKEYSLAYQIVVQ